MSITAFYYVIPIFYVQNTLGESLHIGSKTFSHARCICNILKSTVSSNEVNLILIDPNRD